MDLVFVALATGFFALTAALAYALEKLRGRP